GNLAPDRPAPNYSARPGWTVVAGLTIGNARMGNESMNIETVLRSVVALRSSIPEDAYTAGTLGSLREGSGVVIRESGLVLTIGYLITEAEEVWLTTEDGRVVPAHP